MSACLFWIFRVENTRTSMVGKNIVVADTKINNSFSSQLANRTKVIRVNISMVNNMFRLYNGNSGNL